MHSVSRVWYYFDMIAETRTVFPDIDLLPAGRILAAGTIREKHGITRRPAGDARFFGVLCVHAGTGTFESGPTGIIDLTAGDMVLFFPGVAHGYGPAHGNTWDESFLTFEGTLFEALRDAGVLTPSVAVLHGVPAVWRERLVLLVDLAGRRKGTPDAVFVSTVLQFLCEIRFSRSARHVTISDRQWVDRVYEAVDVARPMAVSLEDVAKQLGTSYPALMKRFTRVTGLSLGRERTRLALERAEALLRADRFSVTQVADELGYSDPAYFCRRFKQLTGLSPGAYRAMATGE